MSGAPSIGAPLQRSNEKSKVVLKPSLQHLSKHQQPLMTATRRPKPMVSNKPVGGESRVVNNFFISSLNINLNLNINISIPPSPKSTINNASYIDSHQSVDIVNDKSATKKSKGSQEKR